MHSIYSDALVDLPYVFGAHLCQANRQRVFLAFSHDGNHRALNHTVLHAGALGREAWTHDIGSRQNEFDGASIDLQLGQDVWILVQKLEGRHVRPVKVLEEEDLGVDGEKVDVF